MFENYDQKDKRNAKSDFKTCKAIFEAMRAVGDSDDTIKKALSAMLAGKPWKDEIIQELFHPYESYKRREQRRRSQWEENQKEYQRNYNNWYNNHQRQRQRQQSSNSGGNSLDEALLFFGFSSIPQPDELKKRYRELALKNHPDKGGDTATFQKLQNYKDQLYARAGL